MLQHFLKYSDNNINSNINNNTYSMPLMSNTIDMDITTLPICISSSYKKITMQHIINTITMEIFAEWSLKQPNQMSRQDWSVCCKNGPMICLSVNFTITHLLKINQK